MDGNIIHRGSPHEFSGFAFGEAHFTDSVEQEGPRKELLSVEFDYDCFQLAAFTGLLPQVLDRFDLDLLKNAWLAWSFPDQAGAMIAWALPDGTGGTLIEFGLTRDYSSLDLLNLEAERLSDITDKIYPELDNALCLDFFGRVFSIRDRWNELVAEYLVHSERGVRMEMVAPGYHISVRRRDDDPPDVRALGRGGATLSSYTLGPEIASNASSGNGIPESLDMEDLWLTGARGGLATRWMARPLSRIAERELVLQTHVCAETLNIEWARVAERDGLKFERLQQTDGMKVRLTNELGLSLVFDAGEVLRRAVFMARSLGEQAVLQDLADANILVAQVEFLKHLREILPDDLTVEPPEEDGLLRVQHRSGGVHILNLWTLPTEFDLSEDEPRARFLSFLERSPPGPLDGPSQKRVCKELHSRKWLEEMLIQRVSPGISQPLYRLRSNLAEVYTHGAFEGSPAAWQGRQAELCGGSIIEAARQWQEDLPQSRWQAMDCVVMTGKIIPKKVLILVGPGIANVVLEPSLVRGLCDAAGFSVGKRAHVFAPRSGLLVLGGQSVTAGELKQVAYRFFWDYARDRLPHLMGDYLHFRAVMNLPGRGHGVGKFDLKRIAEQWTAQD